MSKKISVILILLAGVSWGSSCIFVNYLTDQGFTAFQCTSIRLILAIPFMHLCLLISGVKNYKINLKALLIFAACGIFSVLLMCICYYYSMQHTSAAIAAVLLYTAPIFVMIMSMIFFKEKLTPKKLTVLLLTVAGCALSSGIIGGLKFNTLGIIVGLISGFAYSLYSILTPFAIRQNAAPLCCTAFSFTFAGIFSLLIASPNDTVSVYVYNENTAMLVFISILFSLFTAVIPFVLYTIGLSHTKPDTASILASSEPVTAAICGSLILSQKMDIYQFIGIIIVLFAITLLNINFKKLKNRV